MSTTSNDTEQQLLRTQGALRLVLAHYGRPHDYAALIAAADAGGAAQEQAKAILRAPDAPSAASLRDDMSRILEALRNVPVVGDVYDQRHSDAHMQASRAADAWVSSLSAAAAASATWVASAPLVGPEDLAEGAWRLRAVLYDLDGEPVGSRVPEPAELQLSLKLLGDPSQQEGGDGKADRSGVTQGESTGSAGGSGAVGAADSSDTVYAYVQEGGSSGELYLHAFDSLGDAQDGAVSCTEAAYRTTPIVQVPRAVADTPGFYDAVETLLRGLCELEYAKLSETGPDLDSDGESPPRG